MMVHKKDCPFCGVGDLIGEKVSGSFLGPEYYWRCDDCGAQGPPSDDRDEALALWNNRIGPL